MPKKPIEFSELEIKIYDAAIDVFNRKGLKLTMDDLASELSISKKTIYTAFDSKEALFNGMVDYIFEGIKEREKEVLSQEGITTIEKIRSLLSAMPDRYRTINWQELSALREKFPKVYKKVQKRLETGWESTISLMEKGREEGLISKDADLRVFKIMFEASLARFFEDDFLKKNKISYIDALNEVVDILLKGILN